MDVLNNLDGQALFDAAADAMLLVDGSGCVAAANPSALQMLGYDAAAIAGLPVEMLMPMRLREEHAQARNQFSKFPQKRPMGRGKGLVALSRSGEEIPVEISLSPVQVNGRPYILANLQNIAERKAIEQQYREQRLLLAELLKEQVAAQTAAAIAHELNQPLAAISAYSEVALHALEGASTGQESLRRALEGCVEQAQRAGRRLHELLEFLQKGETVPETMDLNAVVLESLHIVRDDGLDSFQPVLDLAPALPPVTANRLQVQKVLVNLLHNSVEAMRDAGIPDAAITIGVRTLAEKNMAQVTIRDNGPGLDAKTARRAFDPFFTTKRNGMGLGLAISRALVEANGGQLWLDPDSNSGAVFHFTLPFAA